MSYSEEVVQKLKLQNVIILHIQVTTVKLGISCPFLCSIIKVLQGYKLFTVCHYQVSHRSIIRITKEHQNKRRVLVIARV